MSGQRTLIHGLVGVQENHLYPKQTMRNFERTRAGSREETFLDFLLDVVFARLLNVTHLEEREGLLEIEGGAKVSLLLELRHGRLRKQRLRG